MYIKHFNGSAMTHSNVLASTPHRIAIAFVLKTFSLCSGLSSPTAFSLLPSQQMNSFMTSDGKCSEELASLLTENPWLSQSTDEGMLPPPPPSPSPPSLDVYDLAVRVEKIEDMLQQIHRVLIVLGAIITNDVTAQR